MAHVDDFGTSFTATISTATGSKCVAPLDLTSYTVTFRFRKPSGELVDKAATVTVAKKGIAVYIAEEDFLDEVGVWEWQPLVVSSAGQWYGQLDCFTVEAHL